MRCAVVAPGNRSPANCSVTNRSHASFAAYDQLAHPLSHNMQLVETAAVGVEGARDLRELGEWLVDAARLDWLGPAG